MFSVVMRMQHAITFVLLTLVSLATAYGQAGPQPVHPYQHGWLDPEREAYFQTFAWGNPSSGNTIDKYRLYIPPSAQADHRLPLLVWLHGQYEAGRDNVWHLRWLARFFVDDPEYPGGKKLVLPEMFLLAVQSPTGAWSTGASPQEDDPISVTNAIINHLVAEYPIDADRVVLAGVSGGGNGVWDFACRYPDQFAAIAPMASSGGDLSQAGKLVDMGIWAFHSSNDQTPPPDQARAMVAAVVQAGGRAWFTETAPNELYPHDCWEEADKTHHVYDWLLAQRRAKTGWRDRTSAAGAQWCAAASRELHEPVYGWPLWRWLSVEVLVVLVVVRTTMRRPRAKAKHHGSDTIAKPTTTPTETAAAESPRVEDQQESHP